MRRLALFLLLVGLVASQCDTFVECETCATNACSWCYFSRSCATSAAACPTAEPIVDSTSLAACNCSRLVTANVTNVPNCNACYSQQTACKYCQDPNSPLNGYCAPNGLTGSFPANCSWVLGKTYCGTSGAPQCSKYTNCGDCNGLDVRCQGRWCAGSGTCLEPGQTCATGDLVATSQDCITSKDKDMTTTWIILGVIGGVVFVAALAIFGSVAIFRRVKYGAVF